MIPAGDGWKIQVIVPLKAVDYFVGALEPFCAAVVSFEVEEHKLWRVVGYSEPAPAPEAVTAAVAIAAYRARIAEPGVECTPVPATDWAAQSQRAFEPLRAGRYFIQPSHFGGRAPSGGAMARPHLSSRAGSG